MQQSPYLEPIARATLSDQIVDRLVGLILDQGLKPGDKLPSERELMARLSVGRSSLREAVKILSAIGAVEVSAGEGMFVGSGSTSILTKPLSWGLLLSVQSAQEVIEARRLIEVEMAGLAAERASDDEIAAIEELLNMLRLAQDDAQAYNRIDLQFHLAVAAAAHNQILSKTLETIQLVVRAWIDEVTNVYFKGQPHRSFGLHVDITDAIRQHDSQAAREAMRTHIDAGAQRLLNVISDRRNATGAAAPQAGSNDVESALSQEAE